MSNSEMLSRRKAFSLLGLGAALGLAAVPMLTSDAEAQTVGMERRHERRTGRHERRTERRTGRHERREERRQKFPHRKSESPGRRFFDRGSACRALGLPEHPAAISLTQLIL